MIKDEVVPLNPIVSDAFTFIREVATGFGRPLPEWLATLQRLALTDKLHLAGCENAPLDFDVPDDANVEPEAELALYKMTQKFTRSGRRATLPAWFTAWQNPAPKATTGAATGASPAATGAPTTPVSATTATAAAAPTAAEPAPATTGAATGAAPAATGADPADEAAATAAEAAAAALPKPECDIPMFKEGDIVTGISSKHKEDWNGHACEIEKVLSTHYKVMMLEGPQSGESHKYPFKFVKDWAAPQGAAATRAEATGASGRPSNSHYAPQATGAAATGASTGANSGVVATVTETPFSISDLMVAAGDLFAD